jgi:hypothetical protein
MQEETVSFSQTPQDFIKVGGNMKTGNITSENIGQVKPL